MKKKKFCQACHNLDNGIKTRIAVPHTCGIVVGKFNGMTTYSKPLPLDEVVVKDKNNKTQLYDNEGNLRASQG